ncbi:MAG: hypothetical protein AAFN10_19645 [Bacteroidota bacterium]
MDRILLLSFIIFMACQMPPATPSQLPSDVASLCQDLEDHNYRRDLAISPEGDLRLFTLTTFRSVFSAIVLQSRTTNGWSDPEIAPFSGQYRDLEPFFSPDGTYLYFASTRPLEDGGEAGPVNMWRVKRTGDEWEVPENLGLTVNREKDDFYPSVAANGNLYFTAAYEDAIGREDIYVARYSRNAYLEPLPLDSNINSVGFEFNAFIDPQERYILFTAYGREDDMGRGDLYISFSTVDGGWTAARNLGPRVNSPFLDYCPFVTPDESILYFTSERHDLKAEYPEKIDYKAMRLLLEQAQNGSGNIYWINWPSLRDSLSAI